MLLDIYTIDGSINGQIEVQDSVFAIDPSENAMHLAVVTTLANRRQGTRKTKVRSEVSGGGRKPWKQKGRGTARAGSTRSPIWVGGGTIHGPKPYAYGGKTLPKKVARLAKRSALSLRASEKNIIVVEDFKFDSIKTKQMVSIMKNLKIEGEKTLVMFPEANQNVYMSGRNIYKLTLQESDKVSTYDILNHKKILLFKGAVEKFNNSLSN